MKGSIWLLAAAALAFAFAPPTAKGQGCISFQPNFNTYTTESTDGTYIYTSVTFEGTGNMTITNPGSPSCPQGTPVHTAYVGNWIGSVGGRSPGESGCPDCYFSITNNQQAALAEEPPGTVVSYSTSVVCSVAGNFWGSGGDFFVTTPIQHEYPGNPLPNACHISQFFDSVGNAGTAHHAEDVTNQNGDGSHSSPAYGTPIYAMEAGTITKLDGSEGPASPAFPACQGLRKLANTVWIQGTDGYTTRYVHITPLPALKVQQKVVQGQEIGTLDASGCQSGAHLHVGRYPPSGPAVNFTIPCANPLPTNQLWDGTVNDDDTAITP